MRHWKLAGVSAAALIAGASTAWSLTAEDAWNKWQAAAEGYGQTMSAESEENSGGVLTVRGVTISTAIEELDISGRIDEVVFTEQGDGSVAITMSEEIPVRIAGTGSEGEKVDGIVTLSQSGLQMVASDADGGGTDFVYTGETAGVEITELKVDDQDFPMALNATLETLEGSYHLSGGEDPTVRAQTTAAAMTTNMQMQDPEGGGSMKLDLAVSDFSSTSEGKGLAAATEDPANMIESGFATTGTATYGATSFNLDFQESGDSFSASGGLTGGRAEVEVSAERMFYDVAYDGAEVTVSGSAIPFPEVTTNLDGFGIRFEMPVAMGESGPFGLRFALEGLTVGEEIWSMLDPGGVLPRDPATMILDLAGSGRWLVNIFDEEAMMNVENSGEMPGEVQDLALKELRLSLAGAELTGAGAFTFDNSDLTTFNGVPRPAGSVNLKLVGGNGLLDKLVQMGMVPQDQVMMVRMMTGMLAKPGSGADELLSEITVAPDGQLLINGAPMPF